MNHCPTPEKILADPHVGHFEKTVSALFAAAMDEAISTVEAAGYVRGAVVNDGLHDYQIERVDISASSISAYHGYIAHFTVVGRRRLKRGGWAMNEQRVGDWHDLGDLKLVPSPLSTAQEGNDHE